MAQRFGSVMVEERALGDTHWVALRARGAEWSWLTPDDALLLARYWMAAYGGVASPAMSHQRPEGPTDMRAGVVERPRAKTIGYQPGAD